MKTRISIDTIGIHVDYPSFDIYQYFFDEVSAIPHFDLKKGVTVDDFIVKTGGNGYNLSVWYGDVRAYLCKRPGDNCAVIPRMGILVQAGPRFLNYWGWDLMSGVTQFLNSLGVPSPISHFPMAINRLDFCIDVFEFDINLLSFSDLSTRWVGRSKLAETFSIGDIITGFRVGSRQSAIYLRVYNKMLQAEKEGDLPFWYAVWDQEPKHVTRFEWQVSPKKAGFPPDMSNFYLFNQHSAAELGKYLLNWGRLTIPNPNDSVKTRWVSDPLWVLLDDAVKTWCPEQLNVLSRSSLPPKGLTDDYLRQICGHLSSFLALVNPEDPNWEDALNLIDMAEIENMASIKAERNRMSSLP